MICIGSVWRAPAPTVPAWLATGASRASRWWRSTVRIGGPAACRASPIRSTPYAAARAALSGAADGTPKTRDGRVEAIRVLRVVRRGAVKARTQAMNQLKGLIVTAPMELRELLRGLAPSELIETCARLRSSARGGSPPAGVLAATKTALRHLARRYQRLSAEIAELDADLRPLVEVTAPRLLALSGVGPEVAGQLLARCSPGLSSSSWVPWLGGRYQHRLPCGVGAHAPSARGTGLDFTKGCPQWPSQRHGPLAFGPLLAEEAGKSITVGHGECQSHYIEHPEVVAQRDRTLRAARRPEERHRRGRLWVQHPRRSVRGGPDRRVGEARRARRGRCDRVEGVLVVAASARPRMIHRTVLTRTTRAHVIFVQRSDPDYHQR